MMPETSMNTSTNTVKGLLITVVVLIGFNAGQFAWALSREDGGSVPEAIRSGCGAFVTTALLVSALIGLWYGLQNRGG